LKAQNAEAHRLYEQFGRPAIVQRNQQNQDVQNEIAKSRKTLHLFRQQLAEQARQLSGRIHNANSPDEAMRLKHQLQAIDQQRRELDGILEQIPPQ
jgi:hypothetical protein